MMGMFPRRSGGFTVVELLFVLAVMATVTTMAVPATQNAVDDMRASLAARYVAGRLAAIRMDAVARSTCMALRFEANAADYRFATYADGNANGVRSADIAAGLDVSLGPKETLSEKFPGVQFGLMTGYPDADNAAGTGADGVRIGKAQILTMSADGTATAGTLYLHGRRSQFAVRVLGTTGRVRVLQYQPAVGVWVPR